MKKMMKLDEEIPYLPQEIIFDILSRVSPPTLVRCKRVCKAWLHLIGSDEFLKSYKPGPGLAVKRGQSLKFIDFGNEASPDYEERLRKMAFDLKFDLPFSTPLHSAVNGLLLLYEKGDYRNDYIICNPITRDYIRLPPPTPPEPYHLLIYRYLPPPPRDLEICGFGVSRTSGQYKMVRISLTSGLECHVYTVGTGSWRGIGRDTRLKYVPNSVGTFLNGNLHWLVHDGDSTTVSCLDLETELFTTFSPPPPPRPGSCRTLSVLEDCLCVCDNSGDQHRTPEIFIWLMKKYGDAESWTEQFIIYKAERHDFLGYIRPIKAFRDGSIVMELLKTTSGKARILYYSSKTNVIQQAGARQTGCMAICAPGFLSLKTFATERVGSF